MEKKMSKNPIEEKVFLIEEKFSDGKKKMTFADPLKTFIEIEGIEQARWRRRAKILSRLHCCRFKFLVLKPAAVWLIESLTS